MIFFAKSSKSPTLNRAPPLPFSNISLGPVGQFDEIINFLSTAASKRTFGKPSYFEDKTKISDLFINL